MTSTEQIIIDLAREEEQARRAAAAPKRTTERDTRRSLFARAWRRMVGSEIDRKASRRRASS